jgi:predicted DNA-binding protein (UPF0251 family)
MPRPQCRRRVGFLPRIAQFGPSHGAPAERPDEEVVLTVDELEALRLADLEGLYQEQVAESMGVSRQTLGRILDSAHRKVAGALVEGRPLRITGGSVEMSPVSAVREFNCSACGHTWRVEYGTGRPAECPSCQGQDFRRSDCACGHGSGRQPCHRRKRGS